MKKSKQIADRFREILLNGKWIANTNYKEMLFDVTKEQAIKKIGNLNTIAALTFHVDYYLGGVNNVFEGGALEIRDKFSFDVPEIKSEDDWDAIVNRLLNNAEKFAKHIEELSDEQLNAVFVDERYGTYYRNIEGTIEHAYYHLGQISLIKKMILES